MEMKDVVRELSKYTICFDKLISDEGDFAQIFVQGKGNLYGFDDAVNSLIKELSNINRTLKGLIRNIDNSRIIKKIEYDRIIDFIYTENDLNVYMGKYYCNTIKTKCAYHRMYIKDTFRSINFTIGMSVYSKLGNIETKMLQYIDKLDATDGLRSNLQETIKEFNEEEDDDYYYLDGFDSKELRIENESKSEVVFKDNILYKTNIDKIKVTGNQKRLCEYLFNDGKKTIYDSLDVEEYIYGDSIKKSNDVRSLVKQINKKARIIGYKINILSYEREQVIRNISINLI